MERNLTLFSCDKCEMIDDPKEYVIKPVFLFTIQKEKYHLTSTNNFSSSARMTYLPLMIHKHFCVGKEYISESMYVLPTIWKKNMYHYKEEEVG